LKTVWGFGAVYFSGVANFPTGTGTITIMQEAADRTARDGTYRHRVLGYRAKINVKLWNSAADGSDADNIALLLDSLGALSGVATISPRYDAATASTLSFTCICTSDYSMIDVANVPVGQYIELTFVEITRQTSIPTLLSDPATVYVLDESGNSVVDESGNKLTAEI